MVHIVTFALEIHPVYQFPAVYYFKLAFYQTICSVSSNTKYLNDFGYLLQASVCLFDFYPYFVKFHHSKVYN